MTDREIPDPAFWAITAENGAQLIEPGTTIHDTIVGHIGSASTHSVVAVGDILLASKHSTVLDPESMGIRRDEIANYPPATQE